MTDFVGALASGRSLLDNEDTPKYVRNVVHQLVSCLEQAHPAQTDFVELPKDHQFSPEEAAARKLWAESFASKFAGAARAYGYGVFRGGTMVRDIDLVAVPWRQPMPHKTPDLFVLDMCHAFPLQMGNYGTTLHGHRWYALWESSHRDHQIDLKVVVPTTNSNNLSQIMNLINDIFVYARNEANNCGGHVGKRFDEIADMAKACRAFLENDT